MLQARPGMLTDFLSAVLVLAVAAPGWMAYRLVKQMALHDKIAGK